MYDSPIDLYVSDISHQIMKQQDEQIYQAVVHFFPDVKREELLKALRYDRGQYEAGYADGKRDAMDELVRCKDCALHGNCLGEDAFNLCGIEDPFCCGGERKEGDGNG
jgi:hypothetical protein